MPFNYVLHMLNRRFLRIKVLQALYAWFQSEQNDLDQTEKELFKSIKRVYDLYVFMLLLIVDVVDSARNLQEVKKAKIMATDEDKNPNTHFTDNKSVIKLEENSKFKSEVKRIRLNWSLHSDNVRKLFRTIEASPEYGRYMIKEEASFKEDKNFIASIYERYISGNEIFEHITEEQDLYWAQDQDLVDLNVIKTFHKMKPDREDVLLELYRDPKDDQKFTKELLRKTLAKNEEYDELIASYAKNWEVDRLAKIDIMLMKMALTELETFSNIPVKVTLNEYIDLSKYFSTPKSKGFINGVLDKIVDKWKSEGRIQKRGRGLIE